MYSRTANKLLKNINPKIAKLLKLSLVYPRYYKSLLKGEKNYKKFKDLYKIKLFFLAGLPKSGTTWLENMLSCYPGLTPIMPYQITKHEMKFRSSCEYNLPDNLFRRLHNGLFLMKLHIHGSEHNVNVLKRNNIRYCIIYRDLRDAAVSHYYYVKSTPWHPEHQDYKKLNIHNGLKYFWKTRLEEWSNWIIGWRKNRDKKNSIEITYEELLENTSITFKKVAQLFELDDSPETIQTIVEKNSFAKMKKKDANFFRKGVSGNWNNYFDDEIKGIFKDRTGDLLKELGYEKDFDW